MIFHDNITKTYKKSDKKNINKDAKKIALVLDLKAELKKCKKVNSRSL